MKFIAEIGVNHDGSIVLAKKMIDKAKKIGADIVKFQSFNVDFLLNKKTKKAAYQNVNLKNNSVSQYEMLKKYQFSKREQVELIKYCKKKKIEFLSSVFDNESLKFILKQKIKKIKIPSGEINNLILLRELKNFKGEILLSTGMANINEISRTLKFLKEIGLKKKQITLFYCVSDYPAQFSDLNLNTIPFLKKRFNVEIGFSDHTLGIEAPIAATTFGLKYIEKHVTFNNKSEGPDHKASLNFKDFSKMIVACKNINKSLRGFNKKVSNREKKNSKLVRKYLFAKKDIEIGDIFTYENLTSMRFGKGIPVGDIQKIINKKSKKKIFKNSLLKI